MNENNLEIEQVSEKLLAYLKDELKNPEINYASNLKQLQGGYETTIYRFQLKGVKDEYSHPLVLRLYPKFYGTQNATWESTIQNVLANAGYPVAKAHFVCTDLSILGGAFFIMDYIPGQLLISAPPETVMEALGKTHAELHKIDPMGLSGGLKEAGISDYVYGLDSRFNNMRERAKKQPWIQNGVKWLFDHRPPEPDQVSVCHGDFHPLNILIQDEMVTGVLDWSGFVIADPAFDVANTLVLTTIPVKHLIELPDGVPTLDWNLAAKQYLLAYQHIKDLDQTNLDYYRVRRCLLALLESVEGQKVWQHPLIVRDLIEYIQEVTGIQIELPAK
jgi:aminoglycoside phosphotransferase (APT) family kinase protein